MRWVRFKVPGGSVSHCRFDRINRPAARLNAPSAYRSQSQARFRGEADIERPVRPAGSVKNDPEPTLAPLSMPSILFLRTVTK